MPIDEHGRRCLPARTHLNSATSRDVPPPAEAIDKIKERKRRFETINQEITKAGGWVTSIPGDRYIDFEVLPGNPLPAQIRFQVEPNGYGERILPHSVVEYFTRNPRRNALALDRGQHKAGRIQGEACRHRAR